MNLDDLKKQRPTLSRKSEKPPRRGETISMAELRARYGLGEVPARAVQTDSLPPPPPQKPKTE